MRKILLTLIALALAFAFADGPVDPMTRVEVQEAAAFTDGFVVVCPETLQMEGREVVCVNTGDTGWTASDLREWSMYGLHQWRVFKAWAESDGGGSWTTMLYRLDRMDTISITVYGSGFLVFYTMTGLDGQ